MEAELDTDTHGEDEDDGRDSTELDTEEAKGSKQLANNASRDEAEEEKYVRKEISGGNIN